MICREFALACRSSPQAVANTEEIAAVPGVDGLFIGPGDLGLRIARNKPDLTLEQATAKVAAAAERHGKAWGCPAATIDQVRKLQSQGAKLIAYGGDFQAMRDMLLTRGRELAEVYGS